MAITSEVILISSEVIPILSEVIVLFFRKLPKKRAFLPKPFF